MSRFLPSWADTPDEAALGETCPANQPCDPYCWGPTFPATYLAANPRNET